MTIVAMRVPLPIANRTEGERESFTLAALRDTLLPQLVSGELGVPVVVRELAGHTLQRGSLP